MLRRDIARRQSCLAGLSFSRAIFSLALLRSAFIRSVEVMILPPLGIQLAEGRKVQRDPAVPRHLLDYFRVLAHKSQVIA